jgi:flavin reductase (DIM6/NTAB) family NADH-FMN oxidoreductase RutF
MILDPKAISPGALYHHMISVIVPRPIAFVSTLSPAGAGNLAPFSYFCPLSSAPPLVGISILTRPDDPKDTLRNIHDTGEFVIHLVTEPILDAMVRTSGEWPATTNEFEVAGLTSIPSDLVKPVRVKESPVAIECRLHRDVDLGSSTFVIGEILRMHIADELLVEGRVEAARLHAVGRLGGEDYCVVTNIVKRARPRVTRNG